MYSEPTFSNEPNGDGLSWELVDGFERGALQQFSSSVLTPFIQWFMSTPHGDAKGWPFRRLTPSNKLDKVTR